VTFTRVATTADFLFDRIAGFQESGKEFLVARVGGRFSALGNVCTHQGCRLPGGRIRDGAIRCPCHGSAFDPVTGKVLQGPAERPLPVYHVKVENDQVWVDL
jgi:nitrite reductase/ring-hydroxylating ferredoxin subunit